MIVFLLVNAPFFSNWGMEMLIGQLYDTDDTVREEAIYWMRLVRKRWVWFCGHVIVT